MKSTLFFTLLFSILISCKKDVDYQPVQIPCNLTKNLDSCRILLAGTWTWLEEKRMNWGQQGFLYLTPKTEGYTLARQFLNDTARFFRNGRPDSVYTYKVLLLTEISGTNFPEDYDPVVVFYSLHNGLRDSHVPLKICGNYLVFQYQYVTSIAGETIWKKQ